MTAFDGPADLARRECEAAGCPDALGIDGAHLVAASLRDAPRPSFWRRLRARLADLVGLLLIVPLAIAVVTGIALVIGEG